MSFSPLINTLIKAFTVLPGVGPKSAQRMVFDLLQRKRQDALHLATLLQDAMTRVGNCSSCRNFSEETICSICSDPKRTTQTLCVVESPSDVAAIEETASYFGRYFVLMGHLSPLDGIGPDDIAIPKLIQQVQSLNTQEVIIATNCTPEGEATAYYIHQQLQKIQIKCSRIAHGIPLGGELEYLDSGTVSKALFSRTRITYDENT